jgi:hypothetical protein
MKGNYIMLAKTTRLTMLSLFAAIFGFFAFTTGCDQSDDDDSAADDDDSAAADDDDSAE